MFVWPVYFSLPIIHHLYSIRKEKIVLLINFIGFGVNGILTVMLVPLYGYEAAIITTSITQLLMMLFYFIYFNRLNQTEIENIHSVK